MKKPAFDASRPVESFKQMLQGQLKGFHFGVKGLYLDDGTIEPLPREAAVVGKVIEISINAYLKRRLLTVAGLKSIPASSDRVYPDITFNGPLIHPLRFAVDVKCARRAPNGKRTASAITIGTFDAEYFHHPEEKVGNIMMPYGSYTAHLAVVALYTYADATAKDVELLVVEKWRVATKKRASGTRCYIAAVNEIERLKAERGEFSSEEEFNEFWRAQKMSEKKRSGWKAKRASAKP